MSRIEMNEYKKARRNQSRAKTRESLFIAEYVQHKYSNAYMEAAVMYNNLNKKHPRKPDLRRTTEFRAWKNITKAQSTGHIPPKKYKYTEYEEIPLTSLQPLTARLEIPLLPAANITNQSSDKEAQTTIPLLPVANSTRQSSDKEDQTTTHDNPPIDEILQEGDQTPVQQDPNIVPSLIEELSPQVIDKIIQDLRNDPYMADLMLDVEEQIEEELLGLEIDIDEIPDPLGDELNQLT